MKQTKIISFCLIVIFASFGILGFLNMSIMHSGDEVVCPFSFMSNTNCQSDILETLGHHIGQLKNFSGATIALAFVFFSSAVFLSFIIRQRQIAPKIIFFKQNIILIYFNFLTHQHRKILFWISLHLKRDPHLTSLAQ